MFSKKSLVIYFVHILSIIESDAQIVVAQRNDSNNLPDTAAPQRYNLEIEIHDRNLRTFNGSAKIVFEIFTDSSEIYLNCKDLYIQDEAILYSLERPVIWRVSRVFYVKEFCILNFDNQSVQAGLYQLEIRFKGIVRDDQIGLYRSFYEYQNQKRPYLVTQFKGTFARTVFPCFDEPKFKAKFTLSVSVPNEFHILSNTHQVLNEANGNLTRSTFAETPLMSTYLLAFIVSDFDYAESNDSSVRLFAAPPATKYLNDSLEFIEKSLEFLENWLNRTYQLEKLDFVSVESFKVGATENWGLITISEPYLYLDEGNSLEIPAEVQLYGLELIVHELSHIWFGNEVTPEWWSQIWLTEGLAQYFQYFVLDQIKPELNTMDLFVTNCLQIAMNLEHNLDVLSMSTTSTVDDLEQIPGLSNYVHTEKSASIVRMLANLMGEDGFQQAIREYIEARSFNTTNADYFYRAFQSVIDRSLLLSDQFPDKIEKIFKTWTEQPGYPVITISRNKATKTITLQQERFIMNPAQTEKTMYYIPVKFSVLTEEYTASPIITWLTPRVSSMQIYDSIDNSVYVINEGALFFYRVNYDTEGWYQLIRLLNGPQMERLTATTRSQILDDAANLARSGRLKYDILLKFLSYLQLESKYVVWRTAARVIEFLNRMLRKTNEYDEWQVYIRRFTDHHWVYFRNLTRSTDLISRAHTKLFAEILASVQSPQIKNDLMKMHNTHKDIEEWTELVYCGIASSRKTTEANWDALEKELKKVLNQGSRASAKLLRIINGLACSHDDDNLKNLLSLSISSIPCLLGDTDICLRADTRREIFLAVYRKSYLGSELALEFLEKNFVTISILFDSVVKLFDALGPFIVSNDLYEDLKSIYEEHSEYFSLDERMSFEKAMVEAKLNVKWLDTHEEEIVDWLDENVDIEDFEKEENFVDPEGSGSQKIVQLKNLFLIIFPILQFLTLI